MAAGGASTEFDHIIVGAGSAGCVIARRLVDAGRSVALVEAGGPDYNPAIHQPNRAWELWNSPEDWAYTTEPQRHSLKTSVFWPRGKVLGGSSALNGMIYIRGAKADFDNWAYNGALGWSYSDVLPYFKRSEDFEDGPGEYHGVGGPLPVTRIREPNPVTVAMIEAAVERGVPHNDDPNADSLLGVGLTHMTVRNGRRMSTWTAFVEPIVESPLLTVITGSQVKSLVFDGGGRAVGIRLSRPGLLYSYRTDPTDSAPHPTLDPWPATELRCSGDVIVCGGVIGSPQLLLLSGIGPADDLRALGLEVRADLPGVGANLHDHALATVLYSSSQTIPEGKANNLEAHLFAASDPGMPAPDLQPLMSHFPMPVEGYPQPAYGDGYAIVAGLIRPLSRGRLWLRSADPADHPAMDPQYLSEAGRRAGAARQPQALARDRPGPRPQGLARPRDRPRIRRAHRRGPHRVRHAQPDHLPPPGRHLQDGHRLDGRDHPGPARPRHPRPPRSRRLGHALGHLRQHQRPHHHDRRTLRRLPAR